jgi:hypothetical protein
MSLEPKVSLETKMFVTNLTKNINDVIKDLTYLNNKLPFLLNNEFMFPDDLLDMEISLNDLNVHLQLTCMKVEELEHARISSQQDNNKYNKEETETKTETKTQTKEHLDNKLIIKQTFSNFLPFMMMYMMLIDKDSILHSKTFGKKQNIPDSTEEQPQQPILLPNIELD